MTTGRRKFLGLFGAGVAAAPLAASRMSAGVVSHSFGNYPAQAGSIALGSISSGQNRAWSLFHKAAQATIYRKADDRSAAQNMAAGFDPDIAVLNSVSPTARIRMQIAANKKFRAETESIVTKLRREFGLPVED